MKLKDVAVADFNGWLRDSVTRALIETLRAEYHDLLRASAASVAKNAIEDARVTAGRISEIEDLLTMLSAAPDEATASDMVYMDDESVEVGEDVIDPALEV